ncbi:DMT family transporter [Amphritea sp. HPY]|uniref:DMT family transporter n=1 Tax=Amphritea sp. HPY TaxID=3421652 RepID=UPI003D7ED014
MKVTPVKTTIFTLFALLAFAGNSVLCRMALGEEVIDAASFTVIRLLSGVLVLLIITALMAKGPDVKPGAESGVGKTSKGSWLAGFMLFLYALTFSYAYVSLDTGTGALILFGAVQITMILISLFRGTRLHYSEWLGMTVAFAGFVYLVAPAVNTPSLTGFILMTVAGIAWGGYTLKGRGSVNPLADTHYNFLRTIPFILIVAVLAFQNIDISLKGLVLAVLSGAVASGIGYAVWYQALRGLSATQAAVLQLLVPVIAAAGGVIFTDESISLRFIIASVLVLGGIMMVVLGRYYLTRAKIDKVSV